MSPIDKKVRKEVYERDNFTCQICFKKVILTKDIKTGEDYLLEASLDHIIPNGVSTKQNLQTTCRSCNSRKRNNSQCESKFLDLNKGDFTRIHNAILYALSRTKLSSQESRIIFAIFVKTYGFSKSSDWISNSQLEKITKIHRCHCSNTISKLIKRNIVTRIGNKIKFNKYFFNWDLLPEQVTLPKQVTSVTETGNKLLPKQVTTKEIYTKETNTIRIKKNKEAINKMRENLKGKLRV